MTDTTDHIQHTWILTHPTTGAEITIDLWIDDETVQVDGGDGEHYSGSRHDITNQLIPQYEARGYRLTRDYPVNDPAAYDDDTTDEPDDKPDACPECGAPVDHASNHVADYRQGDAWLCTECRWGQWIYHTPTTTTA